MLGAIAMDTAKRCREQSDDCLRLMNMAQNQSEARLLRDIAYSWVRIANQTERYAKFIGLECGHSRAVPTNSGTISVAALP